MGSSARRARFRATSSFSRIARWGMLLPVSQLVSVLPRVGERIDRYRILMEVAHGGMAAVYAVRNASAEPGFAKVLALKVLLPSLASDPHFRAMFLDEARIAAQIQHPAVVQLFDVGEAAGAPFLVMEYLKGQSLAAVARRAPTEIPRSLLFHLIAQAARGLHAAHEAVGVDGKPLMIVHRDVSPQNVHVGYDGHVKVVDFGIAAARGRLASTRSGELKGKIAYLAPEQIDRTRPVDRRVDVWALGVMTFELLSGTRLFRGADESESMWNVLHREIPRLETVVDGVPADVADAVARCLSRRPADRLESAAALAAVLEAHVPVGTGAAELAQRMTTAFTAERAIEEERLLAALRVDPPGPLHEDESSDARTARGSVQLGASESLGGSPARSAGTSAGARVAGVAAAIALVVGVAWGITASMSPQVRAAGARAPAVASPPSASAAPAEAPSIAATPEIDPATTGAAPIRLRIDERARLVLVDGVRDDARPPELSLDGDRTATVEVVGADGTMHAYEVGPGDDGRELAAPGSTAAPTITPTPPPTTAAIPGRTERRRARATAARSVPRATTIAPSPVDPALYRSPYR
jgi:serine/threonine protein kinase